MPTITIWNEFLHEQADNDCGRLCRQHYPRGIHAYLEKALSPALEDCTIRAVSLDMPENGLPDPVLDTTDVLVWWGHMAHGQVPDDLVDRIQRRIFGGSMASTLPRCQAAKRLKKVPLLMGMLMASRASRMIRERNSPRPPSGATW